MRGSRFFACLLVLAISPFSHADYSWFERSWKSHKEDTRAANPFYAEFSEADRQKYLAPFGHLEWYVSSGTISVKQIEMSEKTEAVTYFVRAIDKDSFQILGPSEPDFGFIVRRSAEGF